MGNCYSDCCGTAMDGVMVDMGICPRCHEHCDVVIDDEHDYLIAAIDNDEDYIPGMDDGEWIETDDDFAADYYGEEECR